MQWSTVVLVFNGAVSITYGLMTTGSIPSFPIIAGSIFLLKVDGRGFGANLAVHTFQTVDQYGACDNSVWAGIMVKGRKPLYVLETRTTTAARFLAEVLLPYVHIFPSDIGDNFLLLSTTLFGTV